MRIRQRDAVVRAKRRGDLGLSGHVGGLQADGGAAMPVADELKLHAATDARGGKGQGAAAGQLGDQGPVVIRNRGDADAAQVQAVVLAEAEQSSRETRRIVELQCGVRAVEGDVLAGGAGQMQGRSGLDLERARSIDSAVDRQQPARGVDRAVVEQVGDGAEPGDLGAAGEGQARGVDGAALHHQGAGTQRERAGIDQTGSGQGIGATVKHYGIGAADLAGEGAPCIEVQISIGSADDAGVGHRDVNGVAVTAGVFQRALVDEAVRASAAGVDTGIDVIVQVEHRAGRVDDRRTVAIGHTELDLAADAE